MNALSNGETIMTKSTGQTSPDAAAAASPASHTIGSARLTEPGLAKGSKWTMKRSEPVSLPFPPPACPLCRQKNNVLLSGVSNATQGGTDYIFICEYAGCHTSPEFRVNWKSENFRFK